MRSSPTTAPSTPSHPLPFIGGALTVLVIVALVALFNGRDPAAAAPSAAVNAATGWQTAQGISGAILQVAFAQSPATRGYASVFIDKVIHRGLSHHR